MTLNPVIRQAIKCGPVPNLRPLKNMLADPQTVGEQVIAMAGNHLIVPSGMRRGQPILLEPFQQAFILSVLDNPDVTTEAILSVAARNGKTFVIAVLLLAYLIGPLAEPYTEIASGAMSRDQAALCFKAMHQILQVSPDCRGKWAVVESSKQLTGITANTKYKALSADAKTGYGGDYKVILLDEAGQVRGPRSDFTDMLESRQGSHEDALFLTVSTQGRSDTDFLSQKIDTAIREQDKDTVLHLYSAEPEAGKDVDSIDLLDRKYWAIANPGLGVFRSQRDLEKNLRKAVQIPDKESNARNQYLNQRTAMTGLAISATLWKDAREQPNLDIFRRGRVIAGCDLSKKTDLTAFVMAAEDNDTVHLLPLVFCPTYGIEEREERDKAPYSTWIKQGHLIPIGGKVMDYDQIAAAIGDYLATEGIDVQAVHYDKAYMENFQAACSREGVLSGVEWVGVPQFFKDMGVRLASFQELLLEAKLKHPGNPVLNMAASQAIAKKGREGISALDKDLSTHRIDPLVAAVMAAWPFGDGRTQIEEFDPAAWVA